MKNSTHALSPTRNLAFSALFAALCCVGTLVIVIPLPVGYFNAGDVFVLLSGWCLGPLYGAIAAGLGSALADVISGFPIYAVATFFIKALDALVAYFVCSAFKKFIKKERFDLLSRAFSAILGECVMIVGYFLYESVLYGVLAASGSFLGNVLQGVCCAVCAVLLSFALRQAKLSAVFPKLYE